MNEIKTHDLVIIGGGASALAAALKAYEEGIIDIVILEKEAFLGGILQQCIHNGFGLHTFKEQLTGPEYAQRYIDKIKQTSIICKLNTYVSSITKDKIVSYSNDIEGFCQIKAKGIIISTGCIERTPGAIMLEGDRISGILTAGQAQKYLNIDGYMVGKKVFILGSGDIGLIMARRMKLEGAEVLGVAEIMPYSNGLTRNIVQCLDDFNIPLYLSYTVKKVCGKDHVEKIIIAKVDSNNNYIENSEIEFAVDTLILSVGLIPFNNLLNNLNVKMASTKGAYVDENYQTSIPGIFACGNALHVHDLVDYVSEESALAGKSAANYIKNQLEKSDKMINVLNGNGISYIVPQQYSYRNVKEDILFKFRVKKPYSNVSLVIKDGNEIIKKVKKIRMLPAEMENIKLSKDILNKINNLSIEVMED